MTDINTTLQQAVDRHRAGDLPAAAVLYRQVLVAQPLHADALHLLGLVAFQEKRLAEATDLIGRAVALGPANALYLLSQARVLKDQGSLGQAVASLRHSLDLSPDNPEAHCILGDLLRAQRDLHGAIGAYQAAIRLKGDYFDAVNNLGATHAALGAVEDAIAQLRRAVALRPDSVDALNNLGMTLSEAGFSDEAAATFERAMQLTPRDVRPFVNAGREYLMMGDLPRARHCFAQALEIDPANRPAQSNLLICRCYDPSATPHDVLAAHRQWAARVVRPSAQASARQRSTDRGTARLRVGFVSPDLYWHPVSAFLLPLLENTDRTRFETFCYSDVARPDVVTAKLQTHVDCWRDTRALSDDTVVRLVADDRVDILIDTTGHMADNRLGVFASRAAPLEVSWLGYPSTTGLNAIDARITDGVCNPSGDEALFTERLVRLPGIFACFSPPADAPAVAPLPCRTTGCVTFGSFHSLVRLNDHVIALWARVLRSVPSSRMLICRSTLTQSSRDRISALFHSNDVDTDRIAFDKPTPGSYLSTYARVDIGLDTFPWSGHTTACESLWMGVPVVTLRGAHTASRMVASVLTHAGMPELVADTNDAFVAIAVDLASDPIALVARRSEMRAGLQASPVCDGPRFAREFADALRALWTNMVEPPSPTRAADHTTFVAQENP